MFEVIKNGEPFNEFKTIWDAIDCVATQVRLETQELYDNDEIDKYAKEDIYCGLSSIYKDKGFSHPNIRNDWEIK